MKPQRVLPAATRAETPSPMVVTSPGDGRQCFRSWRAAIQSRWQHCTLRGDAMNTEQMVSAVRESARIDTREHAEKAVRATLRVLGQRLAGEASDLAAQLPPELGAEITASPQTERFNLKEFYR